MTREEYEAKKGALVEEIERVFEGVEREDGVTLHEADAIDLYQGLEVRAIARQRDTESRWQDVPDEDIRRADSNLSFMDAKGFHYYLPAYLVWYLRYIDCEEEGFWSNTFEAIDYKLGVGRLRAGESPFYEDELFRERFSLFSVEEKRTIAHFLQFQHEAPDPIDEDDEGDARLVGIFEDERKESDRYWGQFL